MKHRKTLVDVLFGICLMKFETDDWKIKKTLIAKTGVGKTLAHIIDEEGENIIEMFPRVMSEADPPLETTLLHELIHIGLDLDGEFDTNGVTYWLEKYMWRKLSVEQKAILTKMLEDA